MDTLSCRAKRRLPSSGANRALFLRDRARHGQHQGERHFGCGCRQIIRSADLYATLGGGIDID
jgi:hypothetical protein